MKWYQVLAVIGGTAAVVGVGALAMTSSNKRNEAERNALRAQQAALEAQKKAAADELAKAQKGRPSMGPMVDLMTNVSNVATSVAGQLFARKDVQDSLARGIGGAIGSFGSSGGGGGETASDVYESPEMYAG